METIATLLNEPLVYATVKLVRENALPSVYKELLTLGRYQGLPRKIGSVLYRKTHTTITSLCNYYRSYLVEDGQQCRYLKSSCCIEKPGM